MATAMTDTMETIPAVQVTRRFAASREVVFAALTQPDALRQWFGPDGATTAVADVDLRPGGRYRFEMHGSEGGVHSVGGEYIDIDPPARLVFTWAWKSTPERESLVTITLKPDGDGTLLTLLHEQFADEEARDHHESGWTSSLGKLERLFA